MGLVLVGKNPVREKEKNASNVLYTFVGVVCAAASFVNILLAGACH